MDHFVYRILPPAMFGGKNRAFLFEYIEFKKGFCRYPGQSIQNTIWMKEV